MQKSIVHAIFSIVFSVSLIFPVGLSTSTEILSFSYLDRPTCIISPDAPVQAGETGSWLLIYRVSSEGIRKGGGVKVFIPSGWSMPQLNDPGNYGYTTVSTTNKKVLLSTQVIPFNVMNPNSKRGPEPYCIKIHVDEGLLVPGDKIRVFYGAGPAKAKACSDAYGICKFLVYDNLDGKGTFRQVQPSPSLKVIAGDPFKVTIRAPTDVVLSTPFNIKVIITDEFNNLVPYWHGDLILTLVNSEGRQIRLETIYFPLSAQGFSRRSVTLDGIPEGIYWIKAVDTAGNLLAKSTNATIVHPSSTVPPYSGPEHVLFGDIHAHSNLSDTVVSREPEAYLAKLVGEGLDFGGLSDHDFTDTSCPGSGTCSNSDFSYPDCLYCTPLLQLDNDFSGFWDNCNRGDLDTEWYKMKTACDNEDRIITLLGYEWTSSAFRFHPRSYGHKNVYYLPPVGSTYLSSGLDLFSHRENLYSTPGMLWDALTNQNQSMGSQAITIPHHTASEEPAVTDWSFRNDAMQTVVEIYSSWGNSEADGAMYQACNSFGDSSKGKFVRDALEMGHRLGIIAGSDSHHERGPDGDGPERPPYCPRQTYAGYGLTAVIVDTDSPSRADVFNALLNRKVYGTTGERIILGFKITDNEAGTEYSMGSEFSSFDFSANLTAKITVVGESSEDTISDVSIFWWNVSNGSWVTAFHANPGSWNYINNMVDMSSFARKGLNVYYMRAYVNVPTKREPRTEIAWSSPIWVNVAEP